MKSIFIGGPASEETQLLGALLNAQPTIWCGEELSIFDRSTFFTLDSKRIAAMMKVNSYHELDQAMPYGITIQQPQPMSYCGLAAWRWPDLFVTDRNQTITQLETGDLKPPQVVSGMLQEILHKNGKKVWADRTAGNVFTMEDIAESYSDAKLVVVVRNPYDTITSLCFHRNFSLNNAIIRWLASMEAAKQAVSELGAYVVNYERLTDFNTLVELDELFKYLEEELDTDCVSLLPLGSSTRTWSRYRTSLGDGAIELIERTCRDMWYNYVAPEMGYSIGEMSPEQSIQTELFPEGEDDFEPPTVDGEVV